MVDTADSTSAQWRDVTTQTSDDALLAGLRAGQDEAFAELYSRYYRTAVGIARHVVGRGPAVDDVVAEAFTSLLSAVRGGGGPSSNVRSYLLTTVRNTAIGFLRVQERAVPAEAEVVDRPHHDPDRLVGADDDHRVRRAFAALAPRWRRVLWYVDVHDLPPAQVGPLLGVSPNAVSSLARRARERLRREYLQAHQDRIAPGCEDYAPHLARYVDQTLAVPVQHRVEAHVVTCVFCAAAVDQMRDLKRRMRVLLLPLGLPVAAAGEPRDARSRPDGPPSRAGLRAGPRRARALGRRWWWARPRVGRRALLLGAAFAALCLIMLATVAASDVMDDLLGDTTGSVGQAAAGPDTGGPAPDPRPDLGRAGDGSGTEGEGPPVAADPAPDAGPTPPSGTPAGGLQRRLSRVEDTSVREETPEPTPSPGPEPRPAPHPEPQPEPEPEPEPEPQPDPAPDPEPTPTPTPEPLVLEIEHDDLGDLVPGRPGVLGATVTNPNARPADVVSVDVTLPAGVELDTAGGARAVSEWSCADDAGSPSGVTCTVGTLAGGEASTLLVPVLVAADVPEGEVDLRLDVRGDGIVPTGASRAVPVRASLLAARYVATGPVEVTQVGAPVLHCDPAAEGCAAVTDGTATGSAQDNNLWDMVFVDTLGTGTNSSTAVLDTPAGAEVVAARLYWSGVCGGDVAPVRVARPGGAPAALDSADMVVERAGQTYQASVDVTELVRSGGAGTWGVADVCATEGMNGRAGWALVVVHRPAGAGAGGSGLAIVYDGLMPVSTADGSASFAVAGRPGTPARIGAVAWDGDRSAAGDRFVLDGAPLVPLRWDGSTSAGPGPAENAFDSTAWGSAYANALGVDVKPFEPASLMSARAELTALSDGDAFPLGVVTVATGSQS